MTIFFNNQQWKPNPSPFHSSLIYPNLSLASTLPHPSPPCLLPVPQLIKSPIYLVTLPWYNLMWSTLFTPYLPFLSPCASTRSLYLVFIKGHWDSSTNHSWLWVTGLVPRLPRLTQKHSLHHIHTYKRLREARWTYLHVFGSGRKTDHPE